MRTILYLGIVVFLTGVEVSKTYYTMEEEVVTYPLLTKITKDIDETETQ